MGTVLAVDAGFEIVQDPKRLSVRCNHSLSTRLTDMNIE